MLTNLADYVYIIPAILTALVFHEYAHGLVAHSLGDPTPQNHGRLTLNPAKHLDPLGTIMFIVARFGWAKPVPVNPMYFRGDKQRGMLLVALAGPGANIFLAFMSILILQVLVIMQLITYGSLWVNLLNAIIMYNAILAVFNLIPVPPLDGSKILAGLLPRKYSYQIGQLEQYGPLILLLLIFTGAIRTIFWPMATVLLSILNTMASSLTNLFL